MRNLRPTPLEVAILACVESQHGLVRRDQLIALGLGRRAIHHRLETGRLHELHPGVYALGHRALSREAEYLAALWWCGGGTAIGLGSVAVLKGWVREDPGHLGPVHLVTLRDTKSRPGVVVHRTRRLDIKDVSRLGPLWVTSDARTLIDLADVVSYDRLRAIADELPFLPVDAILAAQTRVPGRHGAPNVHRLVHSEDAHTRFAMERRSVAYFRHHGVSEPTGRNVTVHGIRVDCWYPQVPLVLELDSRAHHLRQQEFNRDRLRDRALERHDITTLRFTWHDLDIDDPRAAQDVQGKLDRARG